MYEYIQARTCTTSPLYSESCNFFDPSTPSMRKVDDREKKRKKREKKKSEKEFLFDTLY